MEYNDLKFCTLQCIVHIVDALELKSGSVFALILIYKLRWSAFIVIIFLMTDTTIRIKVTFTKGFCFYFVIRKKKTTIIKI